jgi:Zn-dependent protease with chaperone function
MLPIDYRRFVLANVLVRVFSALYASLFIALNYAAITYCFPLMIYTLPCLVGGVMLLWSLVPPRERTNVQCRVSSPSLDSSLAEICACAGVPKIERVEAVFAANAVAYSGKGKSRVAIGFPLLATLNQLEINAVLAHEIAHHLYGDTGKGRVVARLDQQLERIIVLLSRRASALILLPFRPVFLGLLRYVRRANRDCEFHADEFAVKTIGLRPSVSALTGLRRVGALWHFFLEHWCVILREGRVAIDLVSMYEAFLASGVADRIRVPLSSGLSGVYDTHPSICDRVERLEGIGAEIGDGSIAEPERHQVTNADELSANFYHVVLNARATSFEPFLQGYPRLASSILGRFGPALSPFVWRDLDDAPRVFSQYSFALYKLTGIDDYEFEKRIFVFLVSYLVFVRSGQLLRVGEYFSPLLTIRGEEIDLWSIVSSQLVNDNSRLSGVLEAIGIDPEEELIERNGECCGTEGATQPPANQ